MLFVYKCSLQWAQCVQVCLKSRPKHPRVRRWRQAVNLTNMSCAPKDVRRSHAPLPNDTRVSHLQEWLFTSLLLFVLALPANQQSLQLLSHAMLICFPACGTVYEESHIEHCYLWEQVTRDLWTNRTAVRPLDWADAYRNPDLETPPCPPDYEKIHARGDLYWRVVLGIKARTNANIAYYKDLGIFLKWNNELEKSLNLAKKWLNWQYCMSAH